MSQTWKEKELVILDDAEDPSFEQPPEFSDVRYFRVDGKRIIPDKRNLVCEAAAGEVIVHFDSDDWSAPGRIEAQVQAMQDAKKSVCGFGKMYFWQEPQNQAWFYNGTVNYVLGSSLMYRRAWWSQHRWDLRHRVGSDNVFVMRASTSRQLVVMSATDMMVARNHAGNTSPKRYGVRFKKTTPDQMPADFFKLYEDRTITASANI